MARITPRAAPKNASQPALAKLDIQQLRALMQEERIEPAAIEVAVDGLTPQRGPMLRPIRELYRGHRQLLARLALPAGVEHTAQDYVLHPALIDGALQSAALLIESFGMGASAVASPQSLASLRLLAPCVGELYAWVRHARSDADDGSEIKFDIDLIDVHGTICVRLAGLAFALPVQASVPSAVRAQPTAGSEEFAALLDSLYRPNPGAAGAGATPTLEFQFEKILEEIL